MKKKKLLLIAPSPKERNKSKFSLIHPMPGMLAKAGTKMISVPPLSLAMIAAYTPKDWEPEIIDERVQDVDCGQYADLVAITYHTASAPRAFYLSKQFRDRKILTAGGGPAATIDPGEAQQHFDVVFIGEAEGLWQRAMDDFKHGRLQRRYQHEKDTFPSLVGLAEPRRDLINAREYSTINTVQISRGCPHNCDFCSAKKLSGGTYRHKPLDDVIEEVMKMRDFQQPPTNNLVDRLVKWNLNKYNFMIFVDDNISGNRQYAKELFRRLIPLGITWGGQASRTIGGDEELLDLAAESGCQTLFIGFESIFDETLGEMGKGWGKNPDKLREHKDLIKKLHDRGIGINGAFILGYDGDPADVFERTVDFIERNHIEMVQFTVPTPYPGTPLRERLLAEGRILPQYGWEHYDCSTVVIKPPKSMRDESGIDMTPEEFQAKFDWAYDQVCSYPSILRRVRQDRPLFYITNMLYRWALHEQRRSPFSKTLESP
ncbi:MAG: radical SAM protein [archaeon]